MVQNLIILCRARKDVSDEEFVLDSYSGLCFTPLTLPDLPLTAPKALCMQKEKARNQMHYILLVGTL